MIKNISISDNNLLDISQNSLYDVVAISMEKECIKILDEPAHIEFLYDDTDSM